MLRTVMSLPVRERGLKLERPIVRPNIGVSLPVRERGLKLRPKKNTRPIGGRSPRGSVD